MPYCASCGNLVSDQAAFCPKCGARNQDYTGGPPPAVPQAGPEAGTLRPLGVGEIIDVAIKLYRRHPKTLMKIVAIVVVPVQILGALVQASAFPRELGNFNKQPGTVPDVEPSDFFTFFAGIVVVGLISFIATQIATGAVLKAVTDAYLGHVPNERTSLEFAMSRLGSLIWVTFLTSLLAGFALLACIAPGVWLWISWSLVVPVLLVEGQRGWAAMQRSFQLVKGRWWPVFGALMLAFILAAIVGNVIQAIFGTALPFASDSIVVRFFSAAIGGAISQVLVTPFTAAIAALIYFDLRVRKEGFDLQILAQRIGSTEPPAPPQPSGPGWEGN